MIHFTLRRITSAPIETVFDIMTDHRKQAEYVWLFQRSSLDQEGDPAPNGTGAVRRLRCFGASFVEEILDYKRPVLWSYTVRSGAPVRDHLGTVTLHETDTGTHIDWHIDARFTVPGVDRLAGPGFKKFIAILLDSAIREAERRRQSG